MTVRIITDSASDIPQTQAEKWNITVIPIKVRFGETEYHGNSLKGSVRRNRIPGRGYPEAAGVL